MRAIALLVLFAVLPSMELAEQVMHVVEHVVHAEVADHDAHHDEHPADEHGCTGLVHLCACHHAQVTPGVTIVQRETIVAATFLQNQAPSSLVDLTTPEPAQRPPIA